MVQKTYPSGLVQDVLERSAGSQAVALIRRGLGASSTAAIVARR
jgi:hypothetical protein